MVPSFPRNARVVLFAGATFLLTGCQSSGGGANARATGPDERSGALFDRKGSDEPGLLMRLLGRTGPEAPPEPTPIDDRGGVRPKRLTVPEDTVNALRLMAQDWVLEARERPPAVRRTAAGTYVREYSTFAEKYTLEIERAEEEDEATLFGYVFLDSVHMITRDHPTAELAEVDTAYHEQRRNLRMTFRLLERWEFSSLNEEFVFNRVWELARIQYKPIVPRTPPPAPVPVAEVQAPQATPRQ